MTSRGRYGNYNPDQLNNARKSAGGHSTRSAHQPKPDFDWDAAIRRCRAMLDEMYDDDTTSTGTD